MGDYYRPPGGHDGHDGPPRMPRAAQDAMYQFQGNRNEGRPAKPAQRKQRQRADYRANRAGRARNGWQRPPVASQRPLLTQTHNDSDLQTFRDPQVVDKFRNPAELTDSEEDDMQLSEDDLNDMPPLKRVKTALIDTSTGLPTPKWSNPDPYTALPPGAEVSGKSFDVVKLIRKAKINASNEQEQDFKHNEDFISFDIEEDETDAPPDAPTGPSAEKFGGGLGKRKRGHEDAAPRPPGGYRSRYDDSVLPEWDAVNADDSTPWFTPCQPEDSASMALHKEIIDFYEWVRPKDYDLEVRQDVITRLSLAFNRLESGEVKPFGSFAAGLYLPIGDMDLVFLQRSFRPGVLGPNGLPEKPRRKLMEKFAKLLRDNEIAKPGSITQIWFAKVPIIKFVDAASGLKVDLSFNNDTGIVANKTVEAWKSKHPAMPILVSIIKQFLMIRGLNDVATGGLGGFSIICLVTSLIQHMPSTGPLTNLGLLLVEFFNLYGNLLDHENVAIRLDPPGYIDKASYKPLIFSDKRTRLTIIDPNRPENNISGGSHLIEQIFEAFSAACSTLENHLAAFSRGTVDGKSFSFLKDLIGGDFGSYASQRRVLQDLYYGMTGRDAHEPLVSKIRPQPHHDQEGKHPTRFDVVVPPARSNGQLLTKPQSTKAPVAVMNQVPIVDAVLDSDESSSDDKTKTKKTKKTRKAKKAQKAKASENRAKRI